MSEVNLQFVDEAVARLGGRRQNLLALLHALQEHYRCLPVEALQRLSQITECTPADVAGVASFYPQFRTQPLGRHLVRVCHGTACHVKGAPRVTEALLEHLGIDASAGRDTDADGIFTVEKVACLGCCTLAPAVQIDNVTYGHLTPQGVEAMLDDFLSQPAASGVRCPDGEKGFAAAVAEVRVGLGSCCVARGSQSVYDAVETVLRQWNWPARLRSVGCVGMCHQTPLLEIVMPDGTSHLHSRVRPQDVRGILGRRLRPRGVINRLAGSAGRLLDRLLSDDKPPADSVLDPDSGQTQTFLGPQRHLATEGCGRLGPTDLEQYVAEGGFNALRLARELGPDEIIARISASGLRGRGGAGFATGRKWRLVADAGPEPIVICNGDEGDPGAFMDRMLLESYPFRVLEGMAIAACAVGARQAILYIRSEYPLAVRRVAEAIDKVRARRLLDGPGGELALSIEQGAGAFVCGEETALIASIEGRRGMPRFRPPYPAVSGLWGRPTLVNNVETFALVPWIIGHGSGAFAALGTESSRGTKVFALAGKVERGGLIEVPMGATIGQIVNEIGGGVPGGRRLKAVQVGGPSGGCIPADCADTPVDYEALTAAGAIMGSGGFVVLDDSDCMVEIARYFIEFTQGQSCGKCTFCRVGTKRMLEILTGLCEGRGRAGDVERLETLAHQVRQGSLCGLGRTAPNPVLSTLKHFGDEYRAHIEGRCPAGSCRALIELTITDKCIGCTLCAQNCPVGAIEMRPYEVHQIDQSLCVRCGVCRQSCPAQAIEVGPRTSQQVQGSSPAGEGE